MKKQKCKSKDGGCVCCLSKGHKGPHRCWIPGSGLACEWGTPKRATQ